MDRDRDESGRPRNARARDELGRPLPEGAEGVPRIPEDMQLSPAETLACAQDLLNQGRAFYAHEVFEAAWKNGPDGERTLWQGLAQLAVGITHIQRENHRGAATLLRRGSELLAGVAGAPYGIDVAGLTAAATALADDLTAGATIDRERLRPKLVR
ncbi:DUF309 domain-containing protein [Mycolicibacterium sp. P1-5]|nr:DUF309 domain-containing protein [Mycolicibacterium sp. P1-5]